MTSGGDPVDRDALEQQLRAQVDGEVRFDAGTRAAYATDASQCRQVPLGVVLPRTTDAAVAAVSVCREHGAPVLSRGGGTSLEGQCTNTAVIIDWSKDCHRLVWVAPDRRRCLVEPGIVLDELNRQLAPHGLRYGPEPASHPNCTLGGMIGNNSCGATAQRTGKVVDNTPRLEVPLYDGTRFWCERTGADAYTEIMAAGGRQAEIYRQLRELAGRYADEIRARFPDIPRRVSGYNLDPLLPEHGFDVAGLLVGSESTLVTVLHAELELVPVVPARTLVVLGYPSVAEAGDAVPAVARHEPIALEGFDSRLVHDERLKHEHLRTIDQLPEGNGWLLVQFGGDTAEEASARARRMLAQLGLDETRVAFLDNPEREDELWRVREGVLGATSLIPGEQDTSEGWDDSAVTGRARLRRLASRTAGLADRPLPRLAPRTLQQWAAHHQAAAGTRGEVVLWPDTFTNTMHPHIGRAAVAVLEDAGWTVRVPRQPLCCGLTWISTGQLGTAKRAPRRTARTLSRHLRAGGLVVGLEPSCTAVFRADAGELLPGEEDVGRLAQQTVTLVELLSEHTPGWAPPDLRGRAGSALVQVHCHQHAVLGWDADAKLLQAGGLYADRLDSGCCGLAGNFGYEPGHLEISRACAERVLLPAVRAARPGTAILADGFSCRTQIEQLSGDGRGAIHLAELLSPEGIAQAEP